MSMLLLLLSSPPQQPSSLSLLLCSLETAHHHPLAELPHAMAMAWRAVLHDPLLNAQDSTPARHVAWP